MRFSYRQSRQSQSELDIGGRSSRHRYKVAERDGKALYVDVKAYVEDDYKDNRVGYKGKREPRILYNFGDRWILSTAIPKRHQSLSGQLA